MTSTRIIKLAKRTSESMTFAFAPTESGTTTETTTDYVVRDTQGRDYWRAWDNLDAAQRVASMHPGFTIDSRELTVTISVGKWESEKAIPKFQIGQSVLTLTRDRDNKATVNDFKAGDRNLYEVNRNGVMQWFYESDLEAAEVKPQPGKFQKGDRVEITNNAATGFWKGKKGTVMAVNSGTLYDYNVKVDGMPNNAAFFADELSPELAEWEKELLTSKFKVGDTIYTRFADGLQRTEKIHKGTVTKVNVNEDGSVAYDVDTDTWRNMWPEIRVTATKFQVGDTVSTFYQGFTVSGTIKRLPVEASPYYIVSTGWAGKDVHRIEREMRYLP